jgi:hypothetical protein
MNSSTLLWVPQLQPMRYSDDNTKEKIFNFSENQIISIQIDFN